MQRLFIFFLSLRGFFTAAIHVKKDKKDNDPYEGMVTGKAITVDNGMLIPQKDGSFRMDPSKLSHMSVIEPLSMGFCAADKIEPTFKETPPSKDEEYYTISKGHKRWLDTKPDTGCEECMELMSHVISEDDDQRVCTDLVNKTSKCMIGRAETLSLDHLGDDPDMMVNFQHACRCSRKYDCHIFGQTPFLLLANWEMEVMMKGGELAKMKNAMMDAMYGTNDDAKKAADFGVNEGVKTEMGSVNEDTMYGVEGLTGQKNARDGAFASHNAGMVGRDLMRDSGDGYNPTEVREDFENKMMGVI